MPVMWQKEKQLPNADPPLGPYPSLSFLLPKPSKRNNDKINPSKEAHYCCQRPIWDSQTSKRDWKLGEAHWDASANRIGWVSLSDGNNERLSGEDAVSGEAACSREAKGRRRVRTPLLNLVLVRGPSNLGKNETGWRLLCDKDPLWLSA